VWEGAREVMTAGGMERAGRKGTREGDSEGWRDRDSEGWMEGGRGEGSE